MAWRLPPPRWLDVISPVVPAVVSARVSVYVLGYDGPQQLESAGQRPYEPPMTRGRLYIGAVELPDLLMQAAHPSTTLTQGPSRLLSRTSFRSVNGHLDSLSHGLIAT